MISKKVLATPGKDILYGVIFVFAVLALFGSTRRELEKAHKAIQ